MASQITTKSAEASFIDRIRVTSNKNQGKTVDVAGGTIRLLYYESILKDTIKSTVMFADTGNAIDNKTALEGLPIVGEENVRVKFKDNNEQALDLTLYVNKVTPMSDDTTKSMVQLDLSSKESILNEKIRLNTKFSGKISDHVRNIFTNSNFLGTDKI